MGYRSDGGIVIYGPKDKMLSHLTMLRMTPEVANVWKENRHTIFDKGDFTVWHFEYSGWKWYPGYEDVQAYEKLWDLSCEAPESQEISGFRWRFGEDDDDTEQDSFGAASVHGELYIVKTRHAEHGFAPPDHLESIIDDPQQI